MQKPKPQTTEYQKLQAAWRKAEREGELIIPCQSVSDARRLRFSLYNAVKAIREGKVFAPEVLEAVNNVSLQLREDPVRLIMQHKNHSPALLALDAVLDASDLADAPESAPVGTPEEAESAARLLGMLQAEPEDGAGKRVTPYYTREG